MSRFAEQCKLQLVTWAHLVSSPVKFHFNYLGACVTPDAEQQGPLSWSDCLQFPGETQRWHAESEGVSQIVMAPVGALQRHAKISNRYNSVLQKPHTQYLKDESFNFMGIYHFGLLAYRLVAASFFEFSPTFWRRYLQSEWNRRKIEADNWISHYYDSTSV